MSRNACEKWRNFSASNAGRSKPPAIRSSKAACSLNTHKGLRITPDLFSDHLVYSACYDNEGRATGFLSGFLNQFIGDRSAAIIQNLAEAEWRASQKHGGTAEGILGSIWRRFLEEFENSSFWDRSQLIEKWSAFAIYQPERTLELAGWAIDLKTAPATTGYADFDQHEQVLRGLPSLLKPLAIWSNSHRQQALDLMWHLHHIRSLNAESSQSKTFSDFAEVASFASNFPDAPTGVLDWLDQLLSSGEAESIADRPCGFLDTVLRTYFSQFIERNYMSDRRTFVFGRIPTRYTENARAPGSNISIDNGEPSSREELLQP